MSLIVQKFGGSSVANAQRVFNVANIITDTYDKGNDVIVVVSAQGDTTDDLIAKAAAETELLITVEEHSIIGGLGAAVAEAVCDTCPVPVVRIGVNDEYGHSGPAVDLLKEFGLCAEHIVEVTKASMAKKA